LLVVPFSLCTGCRCCTGLVWVVAFFRCADYPFAFTPVVFSNARSRRCLRSAAFRYVPLICVWTGSVGRALPAPAPPSPALLLRILSPACSPAAPLTCAAALPAALHANTSCRVATAAPHLTISACLCTCLPPASPPAVHLFSRVGYHLHRLPLVAGSGSGSCVRGSWAWANALPLLPACAPAPFSADRSSPFPSLFVFKPFSRFC